MQKKIFSLIIIPILLSSCTGVASLKFVPYTNYVEEQDLMIDDENAYSKRSKSVNAINTRNGNVSSLQGLLSMTNSDLLKKSIFPKGEKKLLVVPIAFADSNVPSLGEKHTYIENAFFGETKRTTYDSVAGYYNKSSYGQLKITGAVAPWYRNDMIKAKDWRSALNTTDHTKASTLLVAQAVDWLKKQNLIEDINQYDTDGDGYIDAVYAIYDYPLDENGDTNSLFWAYVYYTHQGQYELNNEAPYVNAYAWSSVDKIKARGNLSNTNYLIHEAGHLLGLTDYYNIYASGNNSLFHYGPTGCFDMMDYNIGDHSSFSKYLLQWTSPYVINENLETTTVNLRPFQSSGDYLLIPSSKYRANPSPFSEYLLVDYFTPEGLNKFNGSYSYTDKDGRTGVYTYPQHHGVRIYHINATLGYFQKGRSGSPLIATVDDPEAETKIGNKIVGVDYAYSNSISDEKALNGYPVLIHLLEGSGDNTFIDGIPADNETLFRVGDDFGIATFKDFTFSDGEQINFKLKVKGLSSKEATLEISNISSSD